jgi:predicted transposase YdaD
MSKRRKAARIGAYFDAITKANKEKFQEVLRMSDSELTVEQILEEAGILGRLEAKWEAKGEARGEARGVAIGEAKGKENEAFAIAKKMIQLGLAPETIVSATNLDPEKVKSLYNV